MIIDVMTLGELGELRLIEEVILPVARQHDVNTLAGDDCAYLMANGLLAVTADVGPKPLLHALPGYENDHEAAGWMAVVATASDVATAGAEPLFLTNCIDASPDLTVGEFRQFIGGYFAACTAFGFRNGGGDVRHGPKLVARVFGAGQCKHGQRIGRGGMKPGDQLALIGAGGLFMATYLLALHADCETVTDGRLLPVAEEILRHPRPQLTAMRQLVNAGVISAASDTSDGLLGALDNLRRASSTGLMLEFRQEMLSPSVLRAAHAHRVDPWNVFIAWGDWSVAVAIPADRLQLFADVCMEHQIEHCMLGEAVEGMDVLSSVDKAPPKQVTIIRNENFVTRGFNAGLASHLEYILETPIFS